MHKNSFILGKISFYFLILFIASIFFAGIILLKEDKRKLMEFSNGIWRLSTSKPLQIWLEQSVFCVLNCLVIGVIVLVLGSFFKDGPHYALITTILFVCLATFFSLFAASLKNSVKIGENLLPLSWWFLLGPFFPDISFLKIAVWFTEWALLMVVLFSIRTIKAQLERAFQFNRLACF